MQLNQLLKDLDAKGMTLKLSFGRDIPEDAFCVLYQVHRKGHEPFGRGTRLTECIWTEAIEERLFTRIMEDVELIEKREHSVAA